MSKKVAVFLLSAVAALSAHADFSGDYAHSNWTPTTQAYSCGDVPSSSSIATSPSTLTLSAQGNCAVIGAWYTITAPKSGTISFDWAATGNFSTTVGEYIIDGAATNFTSGEPSGSASFPVQAGQELTLHYVGYTVSQIDISNFTFAAQAVASAPTPVPTVGISALVLGSVGLMGFAGAVSRRRSVNKA
jgi:hypothetical protein